MGHLAVAGDRNESDSWSFDALRHAAFAQDDKPFAGMLRKAGHGRHRRVDSAAPGLNPPGVRVRWVSPEIPR
jgi:hypothetical protein